ncbi:MAG: EF-P lysine aminoacylase GenX [Deltaproteobacteria bacterium]|jgi:lysyl-tRNA synthetase class 2|nr:EF-P lysine aminoacylase GenX [Deltaproteobacteria bacterium]
MVDQNWALMRKQAKLNERARIIQTVRAFFIGRDFLEIETPSRIPANVPEAQIEPIESSGWWLQTSPEVAMKRLLAAGFPNMFQVCRVWRHGERGRYHLPEFTLLEWYRANADYRDLMIDCTECIQDLVPSGRLAWQGHNLNLEEPWEILTVCEAFDRYASISLSESLSRNCFDDILVEEIEPFLGSQTPTFLIDYPLRYAALARTKKDDPQFAERFELYMFGVEIANAFSELTDADEQKTRFEQEQTLQKLAGKGPFPKPEKFLSELGNMPHAAGIALGLDRLVMLMTDSRDIAEVVAFPPEEL